MAMHLPVWTALIRHILAPGRSARTSKRRPRCHVGVIKPRRRHGRTRIIHLIIGTARRGRRIVIHPGTRWRTTGIPITVIIVSTQRDRRTLAITITRTVSTRWRESPVVVINGTIASAGRASPVRITVGTVIIGLNLRAQS